MAEVALPDVQPTPDTDGGSKQDADTPAPPLFHWPTAEMCPLGTDTNAGAQDVLPLSEQLDPSTLCPEWQRVFTHAIDYNPCEPVTITEEMICEVYPARQICPDFPVILADVATAVWNFDDFAHYDYNLERMTPASEGQVASGTVNGTTLLVVAALPGTPTVWDRKVRVSEYDASGALIGDRVFARNDLSDNPQRATFLPDGRVWIEGIYSYPFGTSAFPNGWILYQDGEFSDEVGRFDYPHAEIDHLLSVTLAGDKAIVLSEVNAISTPDDPAQLDYEQQNPCVDLLATVLNFTVDCTPCRFCVGACSHHPPVSSIGWADVLRGRRAVQSVR